MVTVTCGDVEIEPAFDPNLIGIENCQISRSTVNETEMTEITWEYVNDNDVDVWVYGELLFDDQQVRTIGTLVAAGAGGGDHTHTSNIIPERSGLAPGTYTVEIDFTPQLEQQQLASSLRRRLSPPLQNRRGQQQERIQADGGMPEEHSQTVECESCGH